MDLQAVKNAMAIYEKLSPEDKSDLDVAILQVKGAIMKELPALPESDQAAVAWYVAQLVQCLCDVEAGRLSRILDYTVNAYAIACVQLLGWSK